MRYKISPKSVLVLVITILAGADYSIALMLTLNGKINLHSKNDSEQCYSLFYLKNIFYID